jgi:hypothetical protein
VAVLAVVFYGWVVRWVMADPVPPDACIAIPDASYPILDYRGLDGAWVYNGHVVGYSATEDAPCMTVNPITR